MPLKTTSQQKRDHLLLAGQQGILPQLHVFNYFPQCVCAHNTKVGKTSCYLLNAFYYKNYDDHCKA